MSRFRVPGLQNGPEVPIRYAVPALLAIVIVVSVVLTAVLTYVNGRSTAAEVADRLSAQSADQIRESTQAFVEGPSQFNAISVAAWKAGQLNLRNLPELGRYFLYQSRIASNSSHLYYATAVGDFVGVDATSDSSNPLLQIREVGKSPDRLTFSLDANGNQVGQLSSDAYDPRTQPFFQVAETAGQSRWTPISASPGKAGLSMVAAAPAYTPEGKLQGVFGAALNMAVLDALLRDLTPSPSARAFIAERDGKLVASSAAGETANQQSGAGEQPARLVVLDSGDPLVSGAGRSLLAQYGGFDRVPAAADPATGRPQPQRFLFELDGQQQVGQVVSLRDGLGLDWLIVVAVPLEAFMAPVYGDVRETMLVILLALVLAAVPGFLFGSRILRPVRTVTEVAASVEKGTYQLERLDEVATRRDELGHLARVFRNMAAEIRAREQQLMERIARLQIEIDEAERHKQVKEIVESDFFRDLQAKARRARSRKGGGDPPAGG